MTNLARYWYSRQTAYEIAQIERKAKLIAKIHAELKEELK